MTITEKLLKMQTELNAPKNQYNEFGKYNYRNAEGILEAAKPLAAEVQAVILLTEEIINIGNRFYVRAKATLKDNDGEIFVYANAREDETKKGMDGSQITGSATSYARKYALGGLFAIDDGKDADSQNNAAEAPTSSKTAKTGSRTETPRNAATSQTASPAATMDEMLAYEVEIRGETVRLGDMSDERLRYFADKGKGTVQIYAKAIYNDRMATLAAEIAADDDDRPF